VPERTLEERIDQLRDLAAVVSVTPAGADRFTCEEPDWFGERIFGGVIVAQALNAALQTVDGGMRPHSLHGYFLRAARPGGGVELEVDRLRDGRSFSTRHVTMRQDDRLVFWATSSFHADEQGDEYQLAMGPDVPSPDDAEPSEWDEGPFESREAGPTPPEPDGTRRSTRRVWFRGPAGIGDDPAIHVSLAAFLSDMTGTSFRPLSLDEWGKHTDASLDHAVWFHRPFRVDDWLFFDLHALVNTAGRSIVRGAMYTREGKLCLSIAQELLIRPLG